MQLIILIIIYLNVLRTCVNFKIIIKNRCTLWWSYKTFWSQLKRKLFFSEDAMPKYILNDALNDYIRTLYFTNTFTYHKCSA